MSITLRKSGVLVATVISTVLACSFNAAFAASPADGAQKPAHEFKSPYEGGARLPEGGGEPGKAYMALIDAVYKKDLPKICTLMAAGDEELTLCRKNTAVPEGVILLLGNPKAHSVLDGYKKGDEATLDVAYSWADAPDSYGFVVMKQEGGKWLLSTFGASGTAEVDAQAGGTVDLGVPAEANKASGAAKP